MKARRADTAAGRSKQSPVGLNARAKAQTRKVLVQHYRAKYGVSGKR